MCIRDSLIPVRAEDSASLSQKTAELQTELEGINQEMLSISDEIQSIEMQSAIMSGEILRTEEALSSAKANEEQQYEDMKARIKYLYETGNASLLELLFSAAVSYTHLDGCHCCRSYRRLQHERR